ncbi:unnamed protein product [Bursaphelenchus xylophilus]|uniref:(pine wood nematode) hypothetical protein n=1 Tax=Bursaphelenchus xylophilus TaxID=6326 RepID=A0A1I7RYT5_BURXY|nr:unnamed protein product [Bursaphelenchus xylophilus]CAG9092258.1 unnamed protein product [Bursaphelenchus xylophilus]
MLLLDCSFTLHIFSYILIIVGCIVTSPILWLRYWDLKSQTFHLVHPDLEGVSIRDSFLMRCFGNWSEWSVVWKGGTEVWQRQRNTSECTLTFDEASRECPVGNDFEDAVDVVEVNLLVSENYTTELEQHLSRRQNGFWIRYSALETTPVPTTTVKPANKTDPPPTLHTTPAVTTRRPLTTQAPSSRPIPTTETRRTPAEVDLNLTNLSFVDFIEQ